MRATAEALMVAGAVIAVLAGIGLLRFSTPFARIQAAGKASPVALLLTS
ncbi:MAG: cation:proton antiporter, partial [Acidimicrobiaceae bacterium]|nr:cation:proton antiporter [Acidimicrobiaceae bacterium]